MADSSFNLARMKEALESPTHTIPPGLSAEQIRQHILNAAVSERRNMADIATRAKALAQRCTSDVQTEDCDCERCVLFRECAEFLQEVARQMEPAIDHDRRAKRQQKLAELAVKFGNIQNVAMAAGVSSEHLVRVLNRTRGIGDALASKLESDLGLPPGWFDSDAEHPKHEDK